MHKNVQEDVLLCFIMFLISLLITLPYAKSIDSVAEKMKMLRDKSNNFLVEIKKFFLMRRVIQLIQLTIDN